MPKLLILDEYFDDCKAEAHTAGFEVAGPFPSLQQVNKRIASGLPVDAALIDINLDEQLMHSLLDELVRRGIPTVVYTSDHVALPDRFQALPHYLQAERVRAGDRVSFGPPVIDRRQAERKVQSLISFVH
jgi:hypothetical protein